MCETACSTRNWRPAVHWPTYSWWAASCALSRRAGSTVTPSRGRDSLHTSSRFSFSDPGSSHIRVFQKSKVTASTLGLEASLMRPGSYRKPRAARGPR